MVKLDRIVTRGGDGGETSLGDGSRRGKDDVRIEAMGAVDEANAAIGLLRAAVRVPELDAMLARIQNDLFDAGADLCVPGVEAGRLRLTAATAERLEAEVGQMNAGLPPLTSFIMPGGPGGSAEAHCARTLVRRAERRVVALGRAEALNPEIGRALNRLSDHLFVMARVLGGEAVLWVPGG